MLVNVNASLDMEGHVAVNVRVATGVHRWQIASVSQELLSKSYTMGSAENSSGVIIALLLCLAVKISAFGDFLIV